LKPLCFILNLILCFDLRGQGVVKSCSFATSPWMGKSRGSVQHCRQLNVHVGFSYQHKSLDIKPICVDVMLERLNKKSLLNGMVFVNKP